MKKCEICKRYYKEITIALFIPFESNVLGIPKGYHLFVCLECALSYNLQTGVLEDSEVNDYIEFIKFMSKK